VSQTVREHAEEWLDASINARQLNAGQRDRRALVGIGYALLDLADAVREGRAAVAHSVEGQVTVSGVQVAKALARRRRTRGGA
jgi:hypothetical protein